MEVLLLTFVSVNHTMLTEAKLKEEGKIIKVIPTPRQISSSCGLSIMMDIELNTEMKTRKDKDLPIGNLWKYNKNENGVTVEQVG